MFGMGRKTADSNPQADIVFAAMDGLASPVAVAGADGIVYCNPAFVTALNGRRDQYAGRALSSLYAPRQPEGGSGFEAPQTGIGPAPQPDAQAGHCAPLGPPLAGAGTAGGMAAPFMGAG